MSENGIIRRRTFLGAAAVGTLAAPAIGRAQAWPNKPVRVVNAYSAGGTADVVCRIYCQALGEKLGQSFTVDNKPGRPAPSPPRSWRARPTTATRCSTMPPPSR